MHAPLLRWLGAATLVAAAAAGAQQPISLPSPILYSPPPLETFPLYSENLCEFSLAAASNLSPATAKPLSIEDIACIWGPPGGPLGPRAKAGPEPGTPVPLGYAFNAPCVGARDPVVTADQRFLYVANGNICAFALDAGRRAADAIPGMPFRAGNFARALTLDRSSAYLYTANQDSGDVSGFAINPATGALTPVPGSPFPAGGEPLAIAVDGSGRFAYAANNAGRLRQCLALEYRNGHAHADRGLAVRGP